MKKNNLVRAQIAVTMPFSMVFTMRLLKKTTLDDFKESVSSKVVSRVCRRSMIIVAAMSMSQAALPPTEKMIVLLSERMKAKLWFA